MKKKTVFYQQKFISKCKDAKNPLPKVLSQYNLYGFTFWNVHWLLLPFKMDPSILECLGIAIFKLNSFRFTAIIYLIYKEKLPTCTFCVLPTFLVEMKRFIWKGSSDIVLEACLNCSYISIYIYIFIYRLISMKRNLF